MLVSSCLIWKTIVTASHVVTVVKHFFVMNPAVGRLIVVMELNDGHLSGTGTVRWGWWGGMTQSKDERCNGFVLPSPLNDR